MTAFVNNEGLAAVVGALVAYGTWYLGWGGGSGQAVDATGLAAPFAENYPAATASAQTTTIAGDTFRVVGTITATEARSVTEAGVFGLPFDGELCVYGDFPAVNLAAGDGIQFTVDVAVARA